MATQVGVVLFPGSNCELDVVEAVRSLGGEAELALARRRASSATSTPSSLPGGFAHGDYLRPGAIARFSPVMDAVARVRRRRRAGRRHLQRLPGAHRGRAAARARCRRTAA